MTYLEKKENARQKAVVWKREVGEMDLNYYKVAYWSDYFTKLGKRYGLLKEFKENGIL